MALRLLDARFRGRDTELGYLPFFNASKLGALSS
jgi:hypothetical protein